jgi:hypothetical protein
MKLVDLDLDDDIDGKVSDNEDSNSDGEDHHYTGELWTDSESDDDDAPGVVYDEYTNDLDYQNTPGKEWQPQHDASFCGPPAGPQHIPPGSSLLDIFNLLFGALWKPLVRMTNQYAARPRKKTGLPRVGWRPITLLEMKAFIGMMIYMGAQGGTRARAWDPYPHGNEYIKKIMSKRRFSDIHSCVQFVDSDRVSTRERKRDAYWKYRPMIKHLNTVFPYFFNPSMKLSIDEMITPLKGRTRVKQYNKDKPNKWGAKDFALCDAKSGYLLQSHPYQGKDEKKPPGMGLAEFSVRAVTLPQYWNKGYRVHFDNWFMSMGSLSFCMNKGLQCVGTLRDGRKGFPKKNQTQLATTDERGTVKAFRHPNKAIYIAVWKDNKVVRMVSTFPFEMHTCKRTDKNPYSTREVYQPTNITVYNDGMGGVDLQDFFLSWIRAQIRTMNALKHYFIGKVCTVVVNVRVISNFNKPKKQHLRIVRTAQILSEALIQPFLDRK